MMRTKYNVKYAYTLHEALSYGLDHAQYGGYPKASSVKIDRTFFTTFAQVTLPDTTALPAKYLDDTSNDLLNLIVERYWDEYIFESEEEYIFEDDPANYPDFQYKVRRFIAKMFNIIQFTYPKYSAILKAYDDERANLTAKLEKVIAGNATTRNNDTPQDGGDFSDDGHTSYISQGTIDNTESWDSEPIIDRLDKLSKLYHNVMEEWLNEFKDMFIDGGNYL